MIPAAEIALRITCAHCTWTEKNGQGFVSPYAVRESSWYHTRAPNTVERYQFPEFDYEIRTNSLGFRDIEHPVAKPPGEFRLMAIGDSFTEGWGARFDQTWLNELGRELAEKHADSQISIMCAGASGSDPFYGYRLLVDRLMPYRPDWVLLVVNDSDVNDVLLRGGMERFQSDGTVRGMDSPELPWGYASSQLARFILFEVFDYTHALVRRHERERRANEALEKLKELVLEYQAVLAAEGIRFSLVIHPYSKELQRDQYQHLDGLIEFALQHQIDVIDTKPYLFEKLAAHEQRIEDLYWPDDKHFTELGYQYLSEAVGIGLGLNDDWL
jgi:lysophospholipase L1-like esterase